MFDWINLVKAVRDTVILLLAMIAVNEIIQHVHIVFHG